MKSAKDILLGTKYFAWIAVVCCIGSAGVISLLAAVQSVWVLQDIFPLDELTLKSTKSIAISFIHILDLFLIAPVFYIIAVGLYSLFIDADINVPKWLKVSDLDDLKNKLLKVIVLVLSVEFLGEVSIRAQEAPLLQLGVAIGAVIFALSWFIRSANQKNDNSETN